MDLSLLGSTWQNSRKELTQIFGAGWARIIWKQLALAEADSEVWRPTGPSSGVNVSGYLVVHLEVKVWGARILKNAGEKYAFEDQRHWKLAANYVIVLEHAMGMPDFWIGSATFSL